MFCSCATSVPITAIAEVTGGIDIADEEFTGFLILMSYGMYKSLEDATGTEHFNTEIASMMASEFGVQTTLNGVAQAVVDHVVRIHHDTYMTSTDHRKHVCQKRNDITLLVRNFNYPLPNAMNSPTSAGKSHPLGVATTTINGTALDQQLSVIIPSSELKSPPPVNRQFFSYFNTNTNTNTNTQTNRSFSTTYTSSNDSTQSGDDNPLFRKKSKVGHELKLDADGRVEAYVDFEDFFHAMSVLTDAQKETFDADMEPRPDYEPIMEEKEGPPTPNP